MYSYQNDLLRLQSLTDSIFASESQSSHIHLQLVNLAGEISRKANDTYITGKLSHLRLDTEQVAKGEYKPGKDKALLAKNTDVYLRMIERQFQYRMKQFLAQIEEELAA